MKICLELLFHLVEQKVPMKAFQIAYLQEWTAKMQLTLNLRRHFAGT